MLGSNEFKLLVLCIELRTSTNAEAHLHSEDKSLGIGFPCLNLLLVVLVPMELTYYSNSFLGDLFSSRCLFSLSTETRSGPSWQTEQLLYPGDNSGLTMLPFEGEKKKRKRNRALQY